MFGRSKGELAGRPFEILFPRKIQAEYRTAWDACFRSLRRGTAGVTTERTASRKDGTQFSIEIRLSRIATGHGPIAMAFMTDISQRKRAEEEIRRSHEELRALNSRLISVQEESRKHLARELHDVLTQQIATLSVDVNRLQEWTLPSPRAFTAALARVRNGIRTLASDIHKFARTLHPSILYELGAIPALESECNFFQQQFGIRCRFMKGPGVPKRLPDPLGLACYRIAQEAMRNAVRHASSRDIRLRVRIRNGELAMTVADDGCGFDVERARRKGGLGLISMEERARQVNGTLAVISRPGSGTKVELRLPMDGK
jgi:PAS domain S-box-containing protein